MNKPYSISKLEGSEGSNHIIRSRLTNYESKKTAEQYSVKAVKKGIEYYKINGETHQLITGNFIIVNPGQEIEVSIDSPTVVEGICYFLEPDLVQHIQYANANSVDANLENIDSKEGFIFQQSFGHSTKVVNDNFSSGELHNIPINAFWTVLNNYLEPTRFSEWDKYQISEYLIFLAEDLVKHQSQTKQQLNDLEGIRTVTKKELYRRIQRGRQYIHDNYKRSITLKDISRAASLSEYFFHRNFRNFFNITPYQYHNSIRMKKAHQLLRQEKYSKKEVAYICGFQDPKYFSKAYKKWLLI